MLRTVQIIVLGLAISGTRGNDGLVTYCNPPPPSSVATFVCPYAKVQQLSTETPPPTQAPFICPYATSQATQPSTQTEYTSTPPSATTAAPFSCPYAVIHHHHGSPASTTINTETTTATETSTTAKTPTQTEAVSRNPNPSTDESKGDTNDKKKPIENANDKNTSPNQPTFIVVPSYPAQMPYMSMPMPHMPMQTMPMPHMPWSPYPMIGNYQPVVQDPKTGQKYYVMPNPNHRTNKFSHTMNVYDGQQQQPPVYVLPNTEQNSTEKPSTEGSKKPTPTKKSSKKS